MTEQIQPTHEPVDQEQAVIRREPDDQAIQAAQPSAGGVTLLPVEQMQAVLAEYKDRRQAFRRWLLEQMQQGVHYGVPPGCEPDRRVDPLQWQAKPSLYKAGADLLCDLLMMRPEFSADAEAWRQMGSKDGTFVMCCRLISLGSPFFPGRQPGDVIGEGRGAASVGAKKRDANAALKVAQKCAKVDAVITALGLSDLFTQDVEDREADPRPQAQADGKAPKAAPRNQRQGNGRPQPRQDQPQTPLHRIIARWKELNPAHADDTPDNRAAFLKWAQRTTGSKADLSNGRNWTEQDIERCEITLGELAEAQAAEGGQG